MLDDVGQFLNGAGGILALLVTVGVLKDRWPISWLLRRLVTEPVADVIDQRIGAHPKLQAIYAELHPNGGSSMRDAVDRTEHRVAVLDRRVEHLETAGRA